MAAGDFLAKLRLYGPARDFYQLLARRDALAHRRRVRTFFANFIRKRDLVFDVGANDGRYTDAYLSLGARTVAIEPNPALAMLIKRRYPKAVVEEAALGPETGVGTLHLGVTDILSTLSSEWMKLARRSDVHNEWTGETIPVRVTTLDELIERYGPPDYVKIDVEGYEPEVLAGLNATLPLLSFEFQSSAPELAERCLTRLAQLGVYDYNVSLLDRLALQQAWMTGDEMIAFIRSAQVRYGESHGDIFARLRRQRPLAESGL